MDRSGRSAQVSDDSSDDDEPGSGTDAASGKPSETQPQQMELTNGGELLLDATCAPADIAYPPDLSLLNQAREKLEKIIDILHEPERGKTRKPRTYRERARKAYLAVAKQRRVKPRAIRKAIGKQLRFVSRDLRMIAELADMTSGLPRRLYKELLVIQELYRQQQTMYDKRTHSISDRIVSIAQPHVRPIVRGKARANVEFGEKLAISVVNGYAFREHLSWDSYNEGQTLQDAVERYRARFGYYPKAVLADQIYRTRDNLRFCKEGIRLSGPQLGRINNGFAFSITLDIVELFHNYTHLKSLCDDSLLSSVGVTTDNLFVLAKLTSIKDFMRLLINLRRPIGIIGSISTLREYGFLSYESVNSMDITIYPIKSETSNFRNTIPENPINQCANHLRLYIDGDGYIYPCYGLVGLREFSLGNIKDGFENSTFVTDNYDLDLLELKRNGPKLHESTNQLQRVSTLPWICERHRMELLMD